VREDDVQRREVADDGEEERRIRELVAAPWERASSAVDDEWNLLLSQDLICGVKLAVVASKSSVDRMELECGRAVVELSGQLPGDREVQMGIDVRDRTEPPRVVLHEGEKIVETLHPCGARAVLAKQQGGVHALGLEQVVQARRDPRAARVPESVENTGRAELPGPFDPGGPESVQAGDVDVRIDEYPCIQHELITSRLKSGTRAMAG
jgi:hypothetical protein